MLVCVPYLEALQKNWEEILSATVVVYRRCDYTSLNTLSEVITHQCKDRYTKAALSAVTLQFYRYETRGLILLL